MAEFPQNNNAQQDSDISPGGMVQSAPPPPSEVKIRTMRSDLESMARSGGGLPRFENVKISGLTIEKKTTDSATLKKNSSMVALIAVAAVAVLVVVGYFAYKAFFGVSLLPNTNTDPSASTSAVTKNSPTPPSNNNSVPTASSPTPAFVHATAFKKPVDQIITVTFPADGAVQSSADLESYDQKISNALAAANKTDSFLEIDAKFSDGKDLGAADILSKSGAQVLDPKFLAAHFSPDVTVFAYHDKNGFWPGYVFPLRAGENWLFLKGDVQKLETSGALSNLFLSPVGTSSNKGFIDGSIASTTVRIVSFDGIPTSSIVYGWFGNNLIISTSLEGLMRATARL